MRNNYSLSQTMSLPRHNHTNPHNKSINKYHQDRNKLISTPLSSSQVEPKSQTEMQWLSKILVQLKNYNNHSHKTGQLSVLNLTPPPKSTIEENSIHQVSKNGAKKVKVQVIHNKQNRPRHKGSLAMANKVVAERPKSKNSKKSASKQPSKSQNNNIMKNTKNQNKQVMAKLEWTQQPSLNISQIKTQSFTLGKQPQIPSGLWDSQLKNNSKSITQNKRSQKSVGRIVKNSIKKQPAKPIQEHIFSNGSVQLSKQKEDTNSFANIGPLQNIRQVRIKLQTDKLSEYLLMDANEEIPLQKIINKEQSQMKTLNQINGTYHFNQKISKTIELQKAVFQNKKLNKNIEIDKMQAEEKDQVKQKIETEKNQSKKEAQYSANKHSKDISIESSLILNHKSIQRLSQSKNVYQNSSNKQIEAYKQKYFSNSQQKTAYQLYKQQKYNIKNQFNSSNQSSRVSIKLPIKTKIIDDIKTRLPQKDEKLFTLHEQESQYSSSNVLASARKSQVLQLKLQIMVLPTEVKEKAQTILNNTKSKQIQTPTNKAAQISYQKLQIQPQIYFSGPKDTETNLTALFNLLDSAKIGTISQTNNASESLSSELRLLFSSILNQIRTRKRSFNLHQFLTQGHQVLRIKDQIYRIRPISKSAFEVFAAEMQALNKKQSFLLQRSIRSRAQSKQDFMESVVSKRTSIDSSHSRVIQKMVVQNSIRRDAVSTSAFQPKLALRQFINNGSSTNSYTQKQKAENPIEERYKNKDKVQVRIDEPQIYLMRKYGLDQKNSLKKSNDSTQLIMQRARSYLKDLRNG